MKKAYHYVTWLVLFVFLTMPHTALAKKSFKVNDVNDTRIVSPSTNQLYAGEGNVIKGLKFQLSLTNNGDEDIAVGDEGYALTLHFRYTTIDLVTEPIPEPLAVGETKLVEITWGGNDGFSIDPASDYFSDGHVKVSNNTSIGLSVRNEMTGDDLWRVPPFVNIYLDSADYQVLPATGSSSIKGNVGFGVLDEEESVSQTFRIHATASRDVVVTGISLPNGFSTIQTFPVTITGGVNALSPQDQYLPIEVVFNPSSPGVYAGNMVIEVEGMDPKEFKLSGAKKGGDIYYMDFERGTPFEGWILGDGISRTVKPTALAVSGDEVMLNHSYTGKDNITRAITPLLTFAEGEKLVFDARTNNSYGSGSPVIRLLYSSDRVNWQSAGVLIYVNDSYADYPDITDVFDLSSSTYPFRQYQATMPAGDYYVAFEMGYAAIDNLIGGKLKGVDFDLYLQGATAPKSFVVNNPATFNLTAKNISTTQSISADSYEVALYVDGIKRATATTEEWNPNSVLSFEATYVPHKAGETTAYLTLTAGSVSLRSQEFSFVVAEEALSNEITVGTPSSMSTANDRVPFYFYYRNSSSEVILPESFLSQYGIVPGTVITGFTLNGYARSDKTINGELSVKMTTIEEDCFSDESPAAYDLTDIEPLHTSTSISLQSGSSFDLKKLVSLTFDRPYVYNGGNLLIECKSEKQDADVNVYYEWSGELTSNARVKNNDNYDRYLGLSYTQRANIPVFTFTVEKEPATLSGTVKCSDNLVEGAVVTLTNAEADIIYQGITDAEGKYNILVVQADKDYELAVSAEGYAPYTAAEPVSFAQGSVVADIELHDYVMIRGVVITNANHVEVIPNVEVMFACGEDIQKVVTDAEGAFTIQSHTIAGTATLTIDSPDYCYTQATVTLKRVDIDNMQIQVPVFSCAREFDLTVHVASVVEDLNLEGVPFSLVSQLMDESYPETETILDANGSCTLSVYGGKQTLTVKAIGMKEQTVELIVNRAREYSILLDEDVITPRDLHTRLVHDAYTGKNDLAVGWNPAPEQIRRKVMARSAANPYEKFEIAIDGVVVGETEECEYLLENVASGTHTITVTAKYATTQSEPATIETVITDEDYANVVFIVTNNADADLDGETISLSSNDTAAYTLEVEQGNASIGWLPKGEYTASLDVYGFKPYEQQHSVTGDAHITVALEEIVVAPYNLTIECEEHPEGNGLFDITAHWNIPEEGEDAPELYNIKGFAISLDEDETQTSQTTHTFTNVPEGAHNITLKAVYASGNSEALTCPVNLVSGLESIDAMEMRGDIITLSGIVLKRNANISELKNRQKAIYIFGGKKLL